jgi:hypothetical protein
MNMAINWDFIHHLCILFLNTTYLSVSHFKKGDAHIQLSPLERATFRPLILKEFQSRVYVVKYDYLTAANINFDV